MMVGILSLCLRQAQEKKGYEGGIYRIQNLEQMALVKGVLGGDGIHIFISGEEQESSFPTKKLKAVRSKQGAEKTSKKNGMEKRKPPDKKSNLKTAVV